MISTTKTIISAKIDEDEKHSCANCVALHDKRIMHHQTQWDDIKVCKARRVSDPDTDLTEWAKNKNRPIRCPAVKI